MKPTVGRIVMFTFNETEDELQYVNNRSKTAPAIIVSVHEGLIGPEPGKDCTGLNLKVMCDGPEILWKTSVLEDQEGGKGHTWAWPKIVK